MASTKTNLPELGPTLRRLRKERGLTLVEAGKGIRLSTSFLSDLERSRTGPSITTLMRLALFYQVSILDILQGRALKPAPNMHDGHEATCLCCRRLDIEEDRGCSADCRLRSPYFYDAPVECWHDEFLQARHCPDFEERP